MQVMQVMQADNANRAFRGNVAMQVDNFETKQCKWHHLMTKFWTSLQQIRKYTHKKYKSDFKKYNLKLRNMRASQLRFSSQTEQTLWTCVLILSSLLKRLDLFMHTLDSKFRYMITYITWWPNFEPVCNKSENTHTIEIQIRFQEILKIWSWKYESISVEI